MTKIEAQIKRLSAAISKLEVMNLDGSLDELIELYRSVLLILETLADGTAILPNVMDEPNDNL